MHLLLETYLKPMLDQNIDYLVLGCTHYPYLIPMLVKMLPKHVKIIDSGRAVAKQTQAILNSKSLLNSEIKKPGINLYTNGNLEILNSILDKKFNTAYLDF